MLVACLYDTKRFDVASRGTCTMKFKVLTRWFLLSIKMPCGQQAWCTRAR